MEQRFIIKKIVENGYPHYLVYDVKTDETIHCDVNELNSVLYEMMGD